MAQHGNNAVSGVGTLHLSLFQVIDSKRNGTKGVGWCRIQPFIRYSAHARICALATNRFNPTPPYTLHLLRSALFEAANRTKGRSR